MNRLRVWWRYRQIRRTGEAVGRALHDTGNAFERLTFAFHVAFEGHDCPYCKAAR